MAKNTGGENKKKTRATSTAKKTPKKTTAKYVGQSDGIWTAMNNRPFGYGFGGGDYSNPTPFDLLTGFNDVVFSAVHLVSPNVAKGADTFKLVVSTGPNDQAPKSARKSLDYMTAKRIVAAYPQYSRRAVTIEEVADHAVLDLLDRPNQYQSFRKLVELIDVYLEIIGSAFVYLNKLQVGDRSIPTAMWVLPSQYVSIETDDKGEITGYQYKCGDVEKLYAPENIIHFKFTNPFDPYTGFGISPVRAVWQRIQLLSKEQASWDSVLSNMTFPTVLVHPPEGESYTPNQAQRIEKQLSEKGRLGGGQGGIWVVTENMNLESFSTRPKDLSALQLYSAIRSSVATALNIPLAMLDLNENSSEASDTVRRNFQAYCLAPRINNILETFSHHLCPPRMWLAADGVVDPDKVFELQKVTALVGGDILTINEGRVAAGYEPKPGYDKLHSEIANTGTASAQTFQASYTGASTKSIRTKKYQSSIPDPAPLVEALKSVYTKLAASITGKLKSTTPRTKAFFPLETWTDELKATLTPVLRAYYDEGFNGIVADIGGGPDITRHAVQHLDQAVNQAILHLAESTLNTTELSVEDAVAATRQAIRDGLDHGEAHEQLATRIKDIFTDLTDRRCLDIASAESSRAKHNGEMIAIRESGIEAKKSWLPDSMACQLCRELAAKGAVPIDEPYAVKGSGPYSRITSPPGHVNCRCTQQYDLGE